MIYIQKLLIALALFISYASILLCQSDYISIKSGLSWTTYVDNDVTAAGFDTALFYGINVDQSNYLEFGLDYIVPLEEGGKDNYMLTVDHSIKLDSLNKSPFIKGLFVNYGIFGGISEEGGSSFEYGLHTLIGYKMTSIKNLDLTLELPMYMGFAEGGLNSATIIPRLGLVKPINY